MWSIHVALALLASSAQAFTVGQVVTTTSGRFTGRLVPGSDGVSMYKGIPFAKAPVGDLRFAPPVRAPYSPLIRDANTVVSCPANCYFGVGGLDPLPYTNTINWAPAGKQLYESIVNVDTSLNNEDCLLLSVYTKPQTGETGKAVMVFFYGGSFAYGSYGDPRYNGKYLVERYDVVVAVINYRSNIFGFPGAPNTRQNLGWLDQRLAMEWLRDNIAAFGGDPSRMTVFGESSGAASMDYYALAWTKDPIVSAFIPQSGSIYGFPPYPRGSKVDAWRSTAQKLGCFSIFGDAAVLRCMRSKSYQEILNATTAPTGYPGLAASLTFGPIVDDVIVYEDWAARFRSGQFIQVPRLTGTNDNEALVLSPGFQALNGFPLPPPLADILSALVFQCPCANQASDIANLGIRQYRYRWFGYFPNTAFVVGPGATKAFHASEVAITFGTSTESGVPDTAEEVAITNTIMNVWTTFAKDPLNGLAKLGWPVYTKTDQRIVLLAYQNQSGIANLDQASTYDSGCALTAPPRPLGDVVAQFLGLGRS